MKVIIISDTPVLPIMLDRELEKNGFTVQQTLPQNSNNEQQRVPITFYGEGTSSSNLKKLINILAPISVVTQSQGNIEKDEIQLHFGPVESFNELQLDLKTEAERFR